MRVLLTGAAGQLGQALRQQVPPGVELIATSRCGAGDGGGGDGLLPLDLADAQACQAVVHELQPDWVLNAGAYTAVDRAESEPELAQAVNAGAPAAFAQALVSTGGRMLQLSTDFVFDGTQGHPYAPDQPHRPLGVYGASKAAGEAAALTLPGARVLRTSWVYGPVGQNFCRTMLRLHQQRGESGEPLRVVADQVGCPTSTAGLAAACWRAMGTIGANPERGPAGPAHPPAPALPPILHWSDAGVASWYDFAVAIGELGVTTGLLQQTADVRPIMTADYPTPARRPSYSLLDCAASRQTLGLEPRHWRLALLEVLQQLAAS